MPTDLYVHLRDGSDVSLTAVTATPTVVTKTVVSDPYRDLGHRGVQNPSTGKPGLDVVEIENGINGHNFVPPTASIGGVSAAVKIGVDPSAGNTAGLAISAPDNVTHVPPRQVDLLVSYWSFVCSDSIDKFFPVADVIGWSPNPRT